MRHLVLLLLPVFLASCAATPEIKPNYPVGPAVAVKWHKITTSQELPQNCSGPIKNSSCYLWSDNVCHVYAIDSPAGMVNLGKQVNNCYDTRSQAGVSGGKTLDSGVVLVNWYQIKLKDAPYACRPIYSRPSLIMVGPMSSQIRRGLGVNINHDTLGCYEKKGGLCNIYAPTDQETRSTLGHETKHCFDERFHDESGKWRQPLDVRAKNPS